MKNYKDQKWNNIVLIGALAIFLFLGVAYFLEIRFFKEVLFTVVGFIILAIAIITGLISLSVGIIISFITFLTTLPVISTIYANIALIFSRIYHKVFMGFVERIWRSIIIKIFVEKILRRISWYRNLELRLRNSRVVKGSFERLNVFFRKIGLKKPRRIKFFEVIKCKVCNEEVPIKSNFCPFCGENIKLRNVD